MENKNGDNYYFDDSKDKNKENVINKTNKVITIYEMKKISDLELIWGKIITFSKNISKKDILIKYCDLLSQYIKNEIKENNLDLKSNSNSNNHIVLEYFKNNIILEKITNFIITCPDNREVFISYSSYFLNLLKFREEIIKDNKLLKKTIFQTIIHLFEELKKYKYKFKLKNEFSLFLNVVTRIILNYPNFVPFFKVRKENIYTHIQYDDYFIFSCLLILLEIDDTIQEFEHKKYIRRSLIVYLSFDEIINSFYFQKKIIFVEILINKLCNYYQMLPESFDFEKITGNLEIGCNLHFNFQTLCPKYFDYVDYISFLNKITNCLSGNIKNKFKFYFFNKFLINNLQSFILSSDLKKSRTHFQYMISLIYFSKSDLIIDTIINFLFGFRDTPTEMKFNNINLNKKNSSLDKINNNKKIKNSKSTKNEYNCEEDIIEFTSMTEDYIYSKHKYKEIFYLIMNNLTQSKEYINIIIYELFEILFELRPYLMIKKFVKPYADFALNQLKYINTINKNNSIYKYKSYPITIQLIKLINYYNQFNPNEMLSNFESSAYKNFAFYINYDIDFYLNYLNKKKEEEEYEKSNYSTQVSFNSFNSYNTYSSFYSTKDNLNLINKISVDNLMNGLFENNKLFDKFIMKDNIESDFIYLDRNIFNNEINIEERFYNMNFLFMKNLYEKMINFFKNTAIENIFLTNLLLTIISVPCFNFDSDLVECNIIILDDDSNSKYSFLTLFRFLCQEILAKFKSIPNTDKLKKFIKIIIDDADSKNSDKNDFVFKGFLKMKYNENSKDKIEVINFIIFCEFIKEYISSISYKHKFESIIENLYGFYVEELENNNKEKNEI